jgi:hypothetical protein
MTDDVNTPCAEYARLAPLWDLPRTLMGGTKAMRKAATRYLPMEAAESAEAYQARLTRSTLFNGFRKTVRDMTGKVFSKPVKIEDDVPEQIKGFAENIDMAGRHLNVFARDVFFDGMQTGVGYILTEMPAPLKVGTGRGGEVTKKDEAAANRRPYLCYIKAEDLIGWQTATYEGVVILIQARIRECKSEPDGAFSTKEIPQVRVLYPGRWEIWREVTDGADKGKWAKFDEGKTSLSYIPLAPVYINRTGFFTGEPPLEDLADLNVAHWQSQSDQRNILHVARVPILFMAGWKEDDTIEIGSSRACRSSDANAKIEYVEHSGEAIGSGDTDLKNLEFQMQTQGLQLLTPQPGGKTATGEVHDDQKENSQLAMMANALGDALEWSFGFMADYSGLGRDKGGSVKVNTDFGISASAALDIPQIISAYNAGVIDHQTAIEELQRRGLVSDTKDAETILARAKMEAAALDAGKGNGMNLGAAA